MEVALLYSCRIRLNLVIEIGHCNGCVEFKFNDKSMHEQKMTLHRKRRSNTQPRYYTIIL